MKGVLCAREDLGSFTGRSNFASNSMQILLVHLDVHVWIEEYI